MLRRKGNLVAVLVKQGQPIQPHIVDVATGGVDDNCHERARRQVGHDVVFHKKVQLLHLLGSLCRPHDGLKERQHVLVVEQHRLAKIKVGHARGSA